jgi:hypothetical protein
LDSYEAVSVTYRLEGNDISLEKAPVEIVGKVLLNMQGLVSSIGQYHEEKEYINKKKIKGLGSNYNLSVSFKSGSLALGFTTPYEQKIIGEIITESLQKMVFETLANVLSVLSQEDKDDTEVNKEIGRLIDDPATRYRMYSHAKGLLPVRRDHTATMNFAGIGKKTEQILLNKGIMKTRINKGLLEKTPNVFEVEEKGAIVGVRIDSLNPHFMIKQVDGHYTKISLEETMKNEIIRYFANKIPIKIRGIVNKERMQLSKMVEISDIEEYRHLMIESAKEIFLSKPIETEISYEESDNYWFLSNDKLGIHAVGKDIDDAKAMFEERLLLDYEMYKDTPDEELTEDAIELKRELISLFKGRD